VAESFTVRKGVLSDARDISALIESLSRYRSLDTREPPPVEFLAGFAPHRISEYILSGRIGYFVALVRGALVGAIGVNGEPRIVHLFVAENFHRRGIARALWESAKTELTGAVPAGEEQKVLVRSSLYAVAAYERLGFLAYGPTTEGVGVTYVPMRTTIRGGHG
jgi:GNAT superfamily N-acetyltransferase